MYGVDCAEALVEMMWMVVGDRWGWDLHMGSVVSTNRM